MYELQAGNDEGYREGNAIAQHHFNLWQDAKGPPFPWPERETEISGFIEDCLPMLHTVISRKIARDAQASGIDPNSIAIPRDYLRGLDDGYRTCLARLLQQSPPIKLQQDIRRLIDSLPSLRAEAAAREKQAEAAREKLEEEARARDRRDREAAHWNYWHNPANPWNNPDNTSNR